MNLKKLETLKLQAISLDVNIIIVNYDVNRYSVSVGNHSFTDFNRALSAVTTVFLKSNKGRK